MIWSPDVTLIFNLRFPLVKFDYAGDLPLEHGDPQVSRHFGTGCKEAIVAFFKIAAFPVQLGKKTGTTRPHLPQGAE